MTVEEVRDWFAQRFELTAEWREQKAAEYPDDSRNKEAVALLEVLQRQASQIDSRAAEAYGAACEDADVSMRVGEIEQEELRAVGFTSSPRSATEFVNGITERLMGAV